jgi:hypothetical protein
MKDGARDHKSIGVSSADEVPNLTDRGGIGAGF